MGSKYTSEGYFPRGMRKFTVVKSTTEANQETSLSRSSDATHKTQYHNHVMYKDQDGILITDLLFSSLFRVLFTDFLYFYRSFATFRSLEQSNFIFEFIFVTE